ncbi:MAG: 50S ribosomal protein L13 [Fimbriimonadaceae bacterium]|nr:50S ribosomal protein L13 [Fimbriimonadaceae bacterium]
MNRTTPVRVGEIERQWFVVDATDVPLGRLAAQVAQVLRGKHKPNFAYNQDCGDFVVIINAAKVKLTGRKGEEIIYWHTGWPGGIKNVARGKMLETNPVKLVEKVVWGMTSKTKLGDKIFSKLKVYAGAEHPHTAQNPKPLNISKDK